MDYDVVLIGLGPAGSTFARCLEKGYRVLALDKKTGDTADSFHKPCGGLLGPDAQKALSRFNMTLPLDILADPQIFSVRTIDIKTGLTKYYQRHYMNLDRHRFDLWLSSLVPDHVEVRSGARCQSVERRDGGFTVVYRMGGQSYTVTSRFVVGADGANSVVRRCLYPKAKIRTYLSIQQWFADTHATPFYSCVFDRDSTDCYAWGLTKGKYFIFGGAFDKARARESFQALKRKLAPYGFHLDTPLRTEACLTLRPSGPFDFCLGSGGAFLIGEAAGLISPSSLEGISYAIDSGYLLSRSLNEHPQNPNRAYTAATRKMRLKLVGKILKSPFMYQPALRKLVMKSGLSSISVLPGPDSKAL